MFSGSFRTHREGEYKHLHCEMLQLEMMSYTALAFRERGRARGPETSESNKLRSVNAINLSVITRQVILTSPDAIGR